VASIQLCCTMQEVLLSHILQSSANQHCTPCAPIATHQLNVCDLCVDVVTGSTAMEIVEKRHDGAQHHTIIVLAQCTARHL
jgi:hypothetical protein